MAGRGCEKCRNTGYIGRFGLYEQFDVTPEIQAAIAEKAPSSELRRLARMNGFFTLLELGIKAVANGNDPRRNAAGSRRGVRIAPFQS